MARPSSSRVSVSSRVNTALRYSRSARSSWRSASASSFSSAARSVSARSRAACSPWSAASSCASAARRARSDGGRDAGADADLEAAVDHRLREGTSRGLPGPVQVRLQRTALDGDAQAVLLIDVAGVTGLSDRQHAAAGVAGAHPGQFRLQPGALHAGRFTFGCAEQQLLPRRRLTLTDETAERLAGQGDAGFSGSDERAGFHRTHLGVAEFAVSGGAVGVADLGGTEGPLRQLVRFTGQLE